MIADATRRAVEALCHRYQAVILDFTAERLHIAVAETPSDEITEALRFATQSTLDIACWPAARLAQFRQQTQASAPPPDAAEKGETAPQRIQHILQLAIQRRASDIHIEPHAEKVVVRLRIDGVLQSGPGGRAEERAAWLARLKILANLDITERRIPQDGQFSIALDGQNASFRLSTLPTQHGEKAVIRLLQSDAKATALESLGMPPVSLKHFRDALSKPQGMILVTGPTGSGKTFTLYSGLSWLNHPSRNVCSVEDPIEIPLPGINQTQIHGKAGLDFNLVLRALLRQDPDVIMLGEIRDGETAETAVKAAQTGHLVLSTLHTNSTTETLTRLRQIGIPGYLLASALKLVIAQRLVRKLCPHCREPAEALAHLPSTLWPGTVQNWRASGCDQCYSGFNGRIALFELLPFTARMQNALAGDASPDMLADIACQSGLNTLYTEGLHAVNRGETTFEELNRVVDSDHG